jgi:hypothetical protein
METSAQDRVARLEKALARGLELLAAGRSEEARRVLAAVAPGQPEPFGPELSDRELDVAFDGAEPVVEEVVDADRVAREAMHEADLDLGLAEARPGSAFATRTMAELLERQGDVEGASRIRAALAAGGARDDGTGARPTRDELIATLEGWLLNLRRRNRA